MRNVATEHPLPKIGALTYHDFTLDVDYYLKKEYVEIGEACTELPSIIAYVNEMLFYFVSHEEIEKRNLDSVEATVYFELRKGKYLELYAGKMTEDGLKAAVHLDQRVTDATQIHAEAKAWLKNLNVLIDIFVAKLEIIRTVEATRRHIDREISAR